MVHARSRAGIPLLDVMQPSGWIPRCSGVGIGFRRGGHTRGRLVSKDVSDAPTLADTGASFAIATGGVLTHVIAVSPNAGSGGCEVIDEVGGAVLEREITSELPASNQSHAPRAQVNNGATASSVAFDCSGVYMETDF